MILPPNMPLGYISMSSRLSNLCRDVWKIETVGQLHDLFGKIIYCPQFGGKVKGAGPVIKNEVHAIFYPHNTISNLSKEAVLEQRLNLLEGVVSFLAASRTPHQSPLTGEITEIAA